MKLVVRYIIVRKKLELRIASDIDDDRKLQTTFMTKRQKKEKQMHYFWILRISPYIEVAQSFYLKKTHILIKYAIR